MVEISAVLLDLDGLLIDSESVMRTEGLGALQELGYEADLALMDRLIGLDRHAGYRILVEVLGPDLDGDLLETTWRRRVQTHYETIGISPRPGATALFDLLDALSLPHAVVTSSGREGAMRKLTRAGLVDRIGGLIGLDDVTRSKPHPEPYLKGAALVGVAPERCLAFEDSNHGAAAARAAGCLVVQVPDLLPVEGDHAHWVAPDLVAGARAAGLIG